MKKLFYILSFIATNSLIAQNFVPKADALVSVKQASRIMTVGDTGADIQGFTSQSIQFAIDYVAVTGGTVKLTKGTFAIKSPLRMKSNVTLTDAGSSTVLRKEKDVQTRFIVDADYGELKLTVEKTDGFEIGMKVQVTDDEQSSCWNVSTAYISDIHDNVIYINDHLIRDYRSDKNGLVSNSSSVIEILKAENVNVSYLKIDGNRSENYFADGCNSAGILIFKSKKITVDNVHVSDYNGEGISWQITENVTISNCEVSGSGNMGLHPGTGSPFSKIINNDIHHNNKDGMFIYWKVYQSDVLNNKFHHNGRYGICTGHKDVDVLFKGNHIFSNQSDGVNLRGEREDNAPHRNTFEANIFENNGTKNGGYGLSIQSKAHDLKLKDNIFISKGEQTQKAAIYIYKSGIRPTLENNKIEVHPKGEVISEL